MKGATFFLLACLYTATPAAAQPSVRSVVNASSYGPNIPRGCLVSMFGTGLARSTVSASSVPLPTRLDGTAVLVGDLELEAPLYFVSPEQINFQLPFEALGDRLRIVVVTAAGRSQPFIVRPSVAGPGILTRTSDGKGPALAFSPDFRPITEIAPGDPIIIYATGLGATDPPVLSGRAGAAAEPFNRVVSVPEAYVGDAPAQVVYAGLAPGLVGVYQLNLIAHTATTDRVWLRSRGVASNIADIGIRPGRNVTAAIGTIELLYPVSGATVDPIGQSPHLVVARFSASVDIASDAGPFSIAAIADGDASAVVTFDPANGTYQGVMTVPAEPPRHGDFSRTGLFLVDLLTCHVAADGASVCHPFPGAIVPASRMPPAERQVLSALPMPDPPVMDRATGVIRVSGEARRGSTFVINSETNSRLATFGGYVTVPLPPSPNRTVNLRLYVDGRRVASTDVSYRIGPYGP